MIWPIFRETCAGSVSGGLVRPGKILDDREAAWRALALFYDTKTSSSAADDTNYLIPQFTAITCVSSKKPYARFRRFCGNASARPNRSTIWKKKSPTSHGDAGTDSATPFRKITKPASGQDHTHPLTLVPGMGFRSQTVAQVFSGQNLIVFTVKAFDKGKEGSIYRDIDVEYLVDFPPAHRGARDRPHHR